MIMMAIVSAVVGAVIGFFSVGFAAARILVAALGNHDGGSDMGGFFFFGPIGGLAGALLGVGLVLRFGGGSPAWGKGLIISAGVLTGLGAILLAATASPDHGPSYAYVIEFQLDVPQATLAGVDIPGAYAMWGAAGGDADDKPISQFFEKTCDDKSCVLPGSIAALGPMDNFRVTAHIGPKKYRYPLALPRLVNAPMDWSEWESGDGARLRWRIVKK
jgi:hypothetical protein